MQFNLWHAPSRNKIQIYCKYFIMNILKVHKRSDVAQKNEMQKLKRTKNNTHSGKFNYKTPTKENLQYVQRLSKWITVDLFSVQLMIKEKKN